MPSSNARWKFASAPARLIIYRCEQPLDFPDINILVLPSGKDQQLVDSSCCNLDLGIRLSLLPVISLALIPLMIFIFLASWVLGFAIACCKHLVLHLAISRDTAVHITGVSSSAFSYVAVQCRDMTFGCLTSDAGCSFVREQRLYG